MYQKCTKNHGVCNIVIATFVLFWFNWFTITVFFFRKIRGKRPPLNCVGVDGFCPPPSRAFSGKIHLNVFWHPFEQFLRRQVEKLKVKLFYHRSWIFFLVQDFVTISHNDPSLFIVRTIKVWESLIYLFGRVFYFLILADC